MSAVPVVVSDSSSRFSQPVYPGNKSYPGSALSLAEAVNVFIKSAQAPLSIRPHIGVGFSTPETPAGVEGFELNQNIVKGVSDVRFDFKHEVAGSQSSVRLKFFKGSARVVFTAVCKGYHDSCLSLSVSSFADGIPVDVTFTSDYKDTSEGDYTSIVTSSVDGVFTASTPVGALCSYDKAVGYKDDVLNRSVEDAMSLLLDWLLDGFGSEVGFRGVAECLSDFVRSASGITSQLTDKGYKFVNAKVPLPDSVEPSPEGVGSVVNVWDTFEQTAYSKSCSFKGKPCVRTSVLKVPSKDSLGVGFKALVYGTYTVSWSGGVPGSMAKSFAFSKSSAVEIPLV